MAATCRDTSTSSIEHTPSNDYITLSPSDERKLHVSNFPKKTDSFLRTEIKEAIKDVHRAPSIRYSSTPREVFFNAEFFLLL